MANEYFESGNVPAQNAPGYSAVMRQEFAQIAAGFDLLPIMAGHPNEIIVVNATGSSLVTSGVDLTQLATLTGIETITNKTISWADNTFPGFGTAATKNAGTGVDEVLLLAEANKLPILDGSQLTGVNAGAVVGIALGGTGATTYAGAQTALGITLKADANNAVLTGAPVATTASAGNNSARIATTAFVQNEISVVGGFTPSNVAPLINGVASAGVDIQGSRADHVHPTDTSRAPLVSPAFTGNPTAPTAIAGDNDTTIATTAFVTAADTAQMATVAPLIDGTAAVGVSVKLAREDHVHPTDTTRAPLDSPNFTGSPTAPTQLIADNSTLLATTAFTQNLIAAQPVGMTPSNTVAAALGVASAGVGVEGSRFDHVHPTTGLVTKTSSTGSAVLPVGTTAQRDGGTPIGYLRYNTTLSQFEGYGVGGWGKIKSGTTGDTFTGLVNLAVGADIASASTVDLTAATGNTVVITGTTTVTAFTMNAGQQMVLIAAGALPLTYHATTMNINGGANYTCAAGDRLYVTKDLAGVVRVNVTKQDGTAIAGALGLFYKSDTKSVAFTKTGAGAAEVKAGTSVYVAGTTVTFAVATAITMPTLTGGNDYAIYVCTDGTIRADSSFSAPSGYSAGNSRQIGGFHYAPGGNAAAQAGGNTTPTINEYSFWDIKFRPACTDPRGMALIAGSFWADIYLLGVDYLTNGSSKYNVSIADGSSPPKRSTLYGGNGTTTYADGNWWNMNEALKHCGKRSPTYSEFAALAYGTTEATSSGGTDVPTTGVSGTGATSAWNLFTSKYGIIQASGCMWIWGDEFGGAYDTAAYTANTQGRGSTYNLSNAVLLGVSWGGGAAAAGSRASNWSYSPTYSGQAIGARGVSGHLCII